MFLRLRHISLFSTLCVFSVPTFAHDHWIGNGGFRNPVNNAWCCGEQDCFVVAPDTVHLTREGYRLSKTQETVPFSETLQSQDGQYWRCQMPSGARRCFFAPQLGF